MMQARRLWKGHLTMSQRKQAEERSRACVSMRDGS
jgi:hypothetical protein